MAGEHRVWERVPVCWLVLCDRHIESLDSRCCRLMPIRSGGADAFWALLAAEIAQSSPAIDVS